MLSIRRGNAIAARVNAHKAGWDGSICSNPSAWECGGAPSFRQDYCERNDPACFHLHLFNPSDPHFRIHSSGADWLLADDLDALDDQVLVLYNRPFDEPRGIDPQENYGWQVYGLYRIAGVEKVDVGYRHDWLVRPHADDWIRLDELRITLPRFRPLAGQYIKEIDRPVLDGLMSAARQRMAERGSLVTDERTRREFDRVMDALPSWLEKAAEKVAPPEGGQILREIASTTSRQSNPFAALRDRVPETRPMPKVLSIVSPPPPQPEEQLAGREGIPSVVEGARREQILADYGPEVLRSIDIATLTKPLLILRGGPGVGKSTLASSLIDDQQGERSILVAVSSTWRGREDLLGYVNPMDHLFQPTAFTSFLIDAEKAWDRGDRRNRLVILEELNLSQPEYWLSDILVRIEYPSTRRKERTIDLGTGGVKLPGEEERRGVYLSPALRFVATINTDHTTRKLSPRVLDRAAVIELSVDPATAFERLEIELEPDQIEAVQQLDYLVRRKGAAFSYRSARSLKTCLARRSALELETWDVIDHVVVHEVLSKIQLLSGDATDERFMKEALAWQDRYGRWLPQSARMLDSWRDALEEGRDVTQA